MQFRELFDDSARRWKQLKEDNLVREFVQICTSTNLEILRVLKENHPDEVAHLIRKVHGATASNSNVSQKAFAAIPGGIAESLLAMGDLRAALEDVENDPFSCYFQAKEYSPDHVPALASFAIELMKQDKFPLAQILLNRALEGRPNDPRILTAIGVCKIQQKQIEQAKHVFKDLLAEHPKYPAAYFFLSVIERRHGGDVHKAINYFNLATQYAHFESDVDTDIEPDTMAIIMRNNPGYPLLPGPDNH